MNEAWVSVLVSVLVLALGFCLVVGYMLNTDTKSSKAISVFC